MRSQSHTDLGLKEEQMALDTNDFQGSFADENVRFATQIVKTSVYGDTYWKTMIFVENDRFVTVDEEWVNVPGSSGEFKALVVSADTYAEKTTGLLRSWLLDLFVNANINDCILVAYGTKLTGADPETGTATVEKLEEAYKLMKMYAYHKTICAGGDTPVDTGFVNAALKLAQLCYFDREFISSAPYLPLITADPNSNALYAAINNDSAADALMVYHADASHNGALYLLGLALADMNNGSGTPVGNTLCMQKSGNITASGPDGTTPTDAVKAVLDGAHVGYFKPVGDNSGNVACEYADTIKGDVVPASWVRAYITYMCKVDIAVMITNRNFRRNADNYARIVTVLSVYLSKFAQAGVLTNASVTAPGFASLPPSSGNVIVVANAWIATYVDVVKEVRITGTMYIGG